MNVRLNFLNFRNYEQYYLFFTSSSFYLPTFCDKRDRQLLFVVRFFVVWLVCSSVLLAQNDTDGDGLLEVHTLERLNAIRYDLDGDGVPSGSAEDQAVYRTAFG